MSELTSPSDANLYLTPTPRPHPFLLEPKLYVSNLAPDVTDADLALAFEACTPLRPQIERDGSGNPVNGWIDFKFIESAEKALSTLQARPLKPPAPPAILNLSPFPPSDPPVPIPLPQATPRLVKHLPMGTSDAYLWDLFRPYGPLAAVRTQSSFGPNTGIVEFYDEQDARNAEAALHCSEIAGSTIAVQPFHSRRGAAYSDFNAAAAPFIPSIAYSPPSVDGNLPYYAGPYGAPPPPPRGPPVPFMHGPGQQVQFAPLVGPGSGSTSGLIDPCNLFCKNLDSSIDSNDLFTYFRPFGSIVSARVMRGDNGESRGFGFVSYQTPEQASLAMAQMNGKQIGSKQLQVRLHEPKQLRQEKLAHRFAGGPPRSPRHTSGGLSAAASGSNSPAISDGGEPLPATPNRERRNSGSYYQAALAGNMTFSYEELQNLSSVVRNEILTGEYGRRVKELNTVPQSDIDNVVRSLVRLDLEEIVNGFQDSDKLAEQVKQAADSLNRPTSSATSSDTLIDRRPSTTPNELLPHRTTSPAASIAPSSERNRLHAAVSRLEPDSQKADAIAELLYTLTKKERALCLFNNEYLKTKVSDAREVLEADDDEEEQPEQQPSFNQSAPAALGHTHTPLSGNPQHPPASSGPARYPERESSQTSTKNDAYSLGKDNGETVAPEAAEKPPSDAQLNHQPPPEPNERGGNTKEPHTLASLAALPAKEFIKLTDPSGAPLKGLPLPKADPAVTKATDEFIDGLQGKPIQQQKQLVGEKLFKVIKAFGIKGSPKITIALLDSEDLRALSHLMNSYPSVLKEKVMQQVAK